MSTKLRMRPGFRWASSNAVSPPMEWPTRWNLSIPARRRTTSAVRTRNGTETAARSAQWDSPQPGAS